MKFFIETYGCQMNVADSETVASILTGEGHFAVRTIDEADLILFNTCTVRQHAEDRVFGRITQELSRKQTNPRLRVGVIGCVAQLHGEKLLEKIPGLDFCAGVDQYRHLPMMLRLLDDWGVRSNNEWNNKELYDAINPMRHGRFSTFVTIMRGCDNFCTYCIVPHVRGRERSRAMDKILLEVMQAGKQGFKDITLLGQNVNSYQWHGNSFPDLLREVAAIDSIRRIRFVTSHPKDLSDHLIEVMATSSRVCEHIHLPMQSGNNDILRRMNRGYTAEHYLGLVRKLREAMPDIAITSDIIAGFPGETDEQFMDTYGLMEQIRFDYAFTFKYSPREGTKAAEYTDQVPEEIRLERLNKLIALQTGITTEAYKKRVGTVQEVYVERLSKKSDKELSGRTRDNKIAVFAGDPLRIGDFVNVKITDATGWTLKGEEVKD